MCVPTLAKAWGHEHGLVNRFNRSGSHRPARVWRLTVNRLPKKIPASFLRQMDPELALKLETSKITFEADILEIQYRVKRTRKCVTIEITMTEKYTMRITPIRRGPGGIAEWGVYHSNQNQSEEIHFVYQAHIEIVHKQMDKANLMASFTSQGLSLKDLIQKSLRTQLEITSKKIVPLKKGMPA